MYQNNQHNKTVDRVKRACIGIFIQVRTIIYSFFLTIVQQFTIIHGILKEGDQNFTQCFSRVKD
jgi:hypothetical protein